MMHEGRHYQCLLVKGTATLTAWIENKGGRLKEGVQVELLPTRELWTVKRVYDHVGLVRAALSALKNANRASLPSVKPMG